MPEPRRLYPPTEEAGIEIGKLGLRSSAKVTEDLRIGLEGRFKKALGAAALGETPHAGGGPRIRAPSVRLDDNAGCGRSFGIVSREEHVRS